MKSWAYPLSLRFELKCAAFCRSITTIGATQMFSDFERLGSDWAIAFT